MHFNADTYLSTWIRASEHGGNGYHLLKKQVHFTTLTYGKVQKTLWTMKPGILPLFRWVYGCFDTLTATVACQAAHPAPDCLSHSLPSLLLFRQTPTTSPLPESMGSCCRPPRPRRCAASFSHSTSTRVASASAPAPPDGESLPPPLTTLWCGRVASWGSWRSGEDLFHAAPARAYEVACQWQCVPGLLLRGCWCRCQWRFLLSLLHHRRHQAAKLCVWRRWSFCPMRREGEVTGFESSGCFLNFPKMGLLLY